MRKLCLLAVLAVLVGAPGCGCGGEARAEDLGRRQAAVDFGSDLSQRLEEASRQREAEEQEYRRHYAEETAQVERAAQEELARIENDQLGQAAVQFMRNRPGGAPRADRDGLWIRKLAIMAKEFATSEIPAELILAVAFRESSWRPGAVGSRGEMGLLQLLHGSATANLREGEDPFDPRVNIRLGVEHLERARQMGILDSGEHTRGLLQGAAFHGEPK